MSSRWQRPPVKDSSSPDVGRFDALILDIGLPDGSGLDVARHLRSAGSVLPILVLTARDSIHDRVNGLDAGADDYLVKPFAYAELSARLRALVRRGPRPAAERASCGPGRSRSTR